MRERSATLFSSTAIPTILEVTICFWHSFVFILSLCPCHLYVSCFVSNKHCNLFVFILQISSSYEHVIFSKFYLYQSMHLFLSYTVCAVWRRELQLTPQHSTHHRHTKHMLPHDNIAVFINILNTLSIE